MNLLRSARTRIVVGLAIVLLIAGASCQNGQVDNNQVCKFQCDYTDPAAALSIEDVAQVIGNAIVEANANGIFDMTVVVNDHLNNVLAVYDTDTSTIDYTLITSRESPDAVVTTPYQAGTPGNPTNGDFGGRIGPPATGVAGTALDTALDGIYIPNGYAAISKAGTSNYFSTQGNAFSTRTANTLIQQNFVPGETDRPGGPLFAVQIAQLACSDVNTRQEPLDPVTDLQGPRRLPVGFAADPGGLPLYKDGIPELDTSGPPYPSTTPTGRVGKVVVGAVGIEFNGVYGVDKDATNPTATSSSASPSVRREDSTPTRSGGRIASPSPAGRCVSTTTRGCAAGAGPSTSLRRARWQRPER